MKCLICGKEMKVVNNFHLDTHSMTFEEYKERFPDADCFDPEIRKNRSEFMTKRNLGNKHSSETKRKMSEIKKRQIASGEFITPFMTMDKYGDNNPAWGSNIRSEKDINETKELLSSKMAERIIDGRHASSYEKGHFHSNKNGKDFLYRSSYEHRMFNILEDLACVKFYDYECVINNDNEHIPVLIVASYMNENPTYEVRGKDGVLEERIIPNIPDDGFFVFADEDKFIDKLELFNFSPNFKRVNLKKEEYELARKIKKENPGTSFYDIIHMLLAKQTNSILITRDNLLINLAKEYEVKVKKPEETL